jgi:hypothetical protein
MTASRIRLSVFRETPVDQAEFIKFGAPRLAGINLAPEIVKRSPTP